MYEQDSAHQPIRCGYDPRTDTIRPVGADGLAPHEQPLTLDDAVRRIERRVEVLARAVPDDGEVLE